MLKIRCITFFLLFMITSSMAIYAQTVHLFINGDKVDNNHLYGYYPEVLRFDIFNGEVKYKVMSGNLLIMNGGKTVETVTFKDNMVKGDLINHDLLPGSKLQVNIEEISEQGAAQQHKIGRSITINFKKELEVKPNPNFAVLLNNSANFIKFGIDPASIEKVEVKAVDQLKGRSGTVYHIAGTRTTRQSNFASMAELERMLPGFIKDNSVLNGHRILVEVQGGGRVPKIEINIKK